jgi:hypothetical protein
LQGMLLLNKVWFKGFLHANFSATSNLFWYSWNDTQSNQFHGTGQHRHPLKPVQWFSAIQCHVLHLSPSHKTSSGTLSHHLRVACPEQNSGFSLASPISFGFKQKTFERTKQNQEQNAQHLLHQTQWVIMGTANHKVLSHEKKHWSHYNRYFHLQLLQAVEYTKFAFSAAQLLFTFSELSELRQNGTKTCGISAGGTRMSPTV